MGNETLKEDIQLICVRATSFPVGVLTAYKKLEQVDPSIRKRTFYGSHMEVTTALFIGLPQKKSQMTKQKSETRKIHH